MDLSKISTKELTEELNNRGHSVKKYQIRLVLRDYLSLIPESLNQPVFQKAWRDWREYRGKAHLRPYVEQGAKRQLARLAKMGPVRAAAAIGWSIAQNYQGIYEERHGTSNRPRRSDTIAPAKSGAKGYKKGLRVDA